MAVRVQVRGGTTAEWNATNPILMVREIGIDTTTQVIKIGDGVRNWNNLTAMTQGQRGLKGDTGDIGPEGPQGERGIPGPQGKKGDIGPQGDRGFTGEKGNPGNDLEFNWNGSKLGVREKGQPAYEYVELKGVKGDKGDTGDRGEGLNYADMTPEEIASIKGPKGDKGDTGPKGDKGDQGIQGEIGPKGDTGDIENLNSKHIEDALGYLPANVTNEHNHTNKPVIDKFTEVSGKPYYNGAEIGGAVPNLTLTELTLGGRFKIVYNDIEDSLDLVVIE